MLRAVVRFLVGRPWLRVGLAVLLLIVGLAPVGAPILSDSTLRQALQPSASSNARSSVQYRWLAEPDGSTLIQRSASGPNGERPPFLGLPLFSSGPVEPQWSNAGAIPDVVMRLDTTRASERTIFALSRTALWRSDDGAATFTRSTLPDAPLSLAVEPGSTGLMLAGTSARGLYRSYDGGSTWQSLAGAMALPGAGAVGVSTVAINSEDGRVVYAAPGYWTGTTELHFGALGIYTSLDGGSHWFQMVASPTDAQDVDSFDMVTSLAPIGGRPLAVTASTQQGTHDHELAMTPAFAQRLDDPDPAVRVVVARALGLSGNHSVLPILLKHLRDSSRSGEDLLAGDAVAEAIGRLRDPAAVPALSQALADQDEAVRARAAYALGLLKVQEVVPQLAALLRGDGVQAQQRAAGALAAIGTPSAMAALVAPLADPTLTPARQAAMHGIEQAGTDAAPQLTAALHSADPVLRRNAAEALGWVGAVSTTDDLAQALSDADPAVRSEAAWSLGEIGTVPARQALQQAALAEKDQVARQSALQALAQSRLRVSERRDPSLTPGSALVEALGQVPATRWTLLGLSVILAAVLLAGGSQRQLRNA